MCRILKSKMQVEHLVRQGEENLRLEKAQRKEDIFLKEKQLVEEEKSTQKLQEDEFVSNVSKMMYALLEKKFESMVAESILKVTLGA